MDQETYDAHRETIRRGNGVTIEGRSAIDLDQLDFAIRAAGDTVPGDESRDGRDEGDEPEDLDGDGQIDGLEKMAYADLLALGQSLGLPTKSGMSKAKVIEAIRAAQAAATPPAE